MRLILLRHAESQWNLEIRFTGWEDVPLTETGIEEAVSSAKKLVKNNIQLSIIRPTLIYGNKDPHNGYGPNQFFRLAHSNKNIRPTNHGKNSAAR